MNHHLKRLMRRDVQRYILKQAEAHLTYGLGLAGILGIGAVAHFEVAPLGVPVFLFTILTIDHSYKCDNEATYLRNMIANTDREQALELDASRDQRNFEQER